MSDPTPMYLACVEQGFVLTYQESGKPLGVSVGHAGERGDAEKWLVEYGEETDTVALKSLVTGKYLTGEPKYRGKVTVGDDKQYWNILHDDDHVRPPGAYRLSLPGAPKYFLRAFNSSSFWRGEPGWDVVMHDWSHSNAQFMTWYFADADGSSGLTKSKALDEREAALAKKEEDSAAAKKELEDHKKALQDREAELKKQEEESASGKKASEDREAALSKQERDNNKRFDDREAALVQKEKALSAEQRALSDREEALARKAQDHSANEKALKKREAAVAQKEKDQAAEWEKKMKELQVLQQSSTQQKKSPPSKALPPGCGYKHYKPPKLNRKVIGLVYEQ